MNDQNEIYNYYTGLVIALAVEESGLLNRLALFTLSYCGTSDRLLLLGFMVPTAFCSMWISDTATTAMMVKTVQAVLDETESDEKNYYNGNETDRCYGTFNEFTSKKVTEGIENTNFNRNDSSYSSRSSLSDKISCHSNEKLMKCKWLKSQNKVFQKR